MELIPDCDFSEGLEASYFIKDGKYGCVKCLNDFVWSPEDEACVLCSEYIDGCDECGVNPKGETECHLCEDKDFMPSLDGLRCVR